LGRSHLQSRRLGEPAPSPFYVATWAVESSDWSGRFSLVRREAYVAWTSRWPSFLHTACRSPLRTLECRAEVHRHGQARKPRLGEHQSTLLPGLLPGHLSSSGIYLDFMYLPSRPHLIPASLMCCVSRLPTNNSLCDNTGPTRHFGNMGAVSLGALPSRHLLTRT